MWKHFCSIMLRRKFWDLWCQFFSPIFNSCFAFRLSICSLLCPLSLCPHCLMCFLSLDFLLLSLISQSFLSNYYRSQNWLWNIDTKTRSWGFASCIASMCLFCSFSSPLPQYDSRWWLSSLLSPMMPQWCHSLPPPPLSLTRPITLLSPLLNLLLTSHPCGLVFHLHCVDFRSVKSICLKVSQWCAVSLSPSRSAQYKHIVLKLHRDFATHYTKG